VSVETGMQRLLRHRLVEPAASRALLALLLRRPALFFAHEQGGSTKIATDALRGGRGALLTVQHRRPDVQVLDEIFYQGLYDPPGEVPAILDELGDSMRVPDLGGNVGMFGTWLAQRGPFASLVSCGPTHATPGCCNAPSTRTSLPA